MDKWEFDIGLPGDGDSRPPEEEHPAERSRPSAEERLAAKKKRRFRRLGITAAVVLTVVLLAILWDPTEFDGLRRRFIYAKAEKDASGCARLYQYGSDKSGCFASLEGSLVYLTDTRLQLQDENGTTLYNSGLKFHHGAITANETLAAAYDIGGTEIYLLDHKELVRRLDCTGTIISARLNQKGYLAVTAEKSGYKAAVYAYDPEGRLIFEFDSADRFVMTAAVSRDGRSLAAITMGESSGTFVSRTVVYRMDETEPVGLCEMSGSILYEIDTLGRGYAAVGENALYFVDSRGDLSASWSFGEDVLRRCALTGDDFVVLLLSRYKTGGQSRLVTLDDEGAVLRELTVDDDVLSISAAGRYAAVLYDDRLVIYDKDLTECAVLRDVSAAKQVLMRRDGSAILAGSSAASLYLP